MNDLLNPTVPAVFDTLQIATAQISFQLACEPLTGALLRTLAASKPAGKFLEIGTGTGIGTCWILDGMDAYSTLTTVDRDTKVNAVAQQYLGQDTRVQFITADAEVFLKTMQEQGEPVFDFIFADTFPGKFHLLDEALALLKRGGLYVIDDLLPQTTWPENHQGNVDRLIAELEGRADLCLTKLAWASGMIIAAKIA